MKNADSTLVDPYQYATQSRDVASKLSRLDLPRFSELAEFDESGVTYTMTFFYDEEKRCCIQGNAKVSIKLKCYRCLQMYPYTIDTNFQLYTVENDVTNNLSKQLEVVVMKNGLVSLVNIVEDELILSLPLAQVHAENDPACSGLYSSSLKSDDEVKPDNAFANFKNLVNRQEKNRSTYNGGTKKS